MKIRVQNVIFQQPRNGDLMISLRSKITRKLLNFFFLNPHKSLYVNELSRKLSLDKRNLVKKIRELEQERILKGETRGNLKFYSINEDYPLYQEYKRIIFKTIILKQTKSQKKRKE